MFKHLALASALFAAGLTAAHAAPTTYQMDPTHTDVIAQWNHFGFSNPIAHFGQVDGSITYDPEDVSASSVRVSIPLSGLNSHVPAFDKHLRASDLFDAEAFPTIEFQSTSVAPVAPDKLKVLGDLTVRGVTKPVVLDVTLNGQGSHAMTGAQAIGFDAKTTLLRSDFGLGLHVPAVSDEVLIRITTEAVVPSP